MLDIDCCDPEIKDDDRCFNIDITDDEFYTDKRTCFSFTRSDTICTNGETREQLNGITSFIDASNVYGSDELTAKGLRSETELGEMKVHKEGPTLPTRKQCGFKSERVQFEDDLVAGDVRAIEHPPLASIHSLFLNEHNSIVRGLEPYISEAMPHLTPEEKDELLSHPYILKN